MEGSGFGSPVAVTPLLTDATAADGGALQVVELTQASAKAASTETSMRTGTSRPTSFKLAANATVARQHGLKLSTALLARADDVVELPNSNVVTDVRWERAPKTTTQVNC